MKSELGVLKTGELYAEKSLYEQGKIAIGNQIIN